MLWEFASAMTPSVVGGSGIAMFIIGREGIALGRATAIVLVTAMMDELFYVVAVPIVFLAVGMENLFPAQLDHAFWGLPIKSIFWIGYGFIMLLVLIVFYSIFFKPRAFKFVLLKIFKLPFLRRWRPGVIRVGMKFGTKAIHAGVEPDPTTGAIMTPIYQTSTYVQAAPGDHKGYEYSRTHNPTRTALQNALAALGERERTASASPAAWRASMPSCKLLKPGDEVVSTNDLYGGTYRLFTKIFEGFGIKFRFVDMGDTANVANAIVTARPSSSGPKHPTNPMLAHHRHRGGFRAREGRRAACSAWTTPSLPLPANATGPGCRHRDAQRDEVPRRPQRRGDGCPGGEGRRPGMSAWPFIQNSSGATPGPQDCFLVLRGLKTLHLRMQRHCENGKAIAEFLGSTRRWTNSTGPASHAQEPRDRRQADARFRRNDELHPEGRQHGRRHQGALSTKLFSLAESLGGVESLWATRPA
jgi:cystathionine gamma-lyase